MCVVGGFSDPDRVRGGEQNPLLLCEVFRLTVELRHRHPTALLFEEKFECDKARAFS